MLRGSLIADVGAGTGKLSDCIARAGFIPVPIEPDHGMREMARAAKPWIPSPGSAEDTGLADSSVAAVVCGQALHYFNPLASMREFTRIAPGGCLVSFLNYPAPGSLVEELLRLANRGNEFSLMSTMGHYCALLGSPSERVEVHSERRNQRSVLELVMSSSDAAGFDATLVGGGSPQAHQKTRRKVRAIRAGQGQHDWAAVGP